MPRTPSSTDRHEHARPTNESCNLCQISKSTTLARAASWNRQFPLHRATHLASAGVVWMTPPERLDIVAAMRKAGGSEPCIHLTVMGVAGSGKSSVAATLGREFALEVIEGDDHHPPANIEKMAAGIPLTDEDRRPWLQTLADLVGARHAASVGTVLACSALRRSYRDILRSTVPSDESFVIDLEGDAETLRSRIAERTGHFMPVSLLESQLATLEPLQPDERGAIFDVRRSLDAVLDEASSAVRSKARF